MAERPVTFTPGEVPCTYHPDVTTGLRCNRCGKPICPQCAVRTPVGLRCPDCAGVRGLPTVRTSSSMLFRAALAAVGVGLLVTVLWYVAPTFKFYLSLALGFGVAEAMAHVTRGKRGTDLQIVGLVIVTLTMAAIRVALALKYGVPLEQMLSDERIVFTDGDRLVSGIPRQIIQLQIVPDILFMAMTWIIVWIRFR